MTVSETVKASGLTPSSGYQGIETADDFIFAICPSDDKADKIGDWLVATERIREHSGSLNATTNDATYIRTGPITTKGNTQRTFSIQGDRYVGDAFQDKLLSLDLIFGSGQSVVLPYVYFSLRTGKGEKGSAAFIVTSDVGGSAGAAATFAVDVKGIGKPVVFDYSTIAAEAAAAPQKAVKA